MDAKILVVDDEAAIADLVEVYLQNEGCTVYKYYTAEEALHCIETETLDLALLDVMLPGTDGFAICRKIRESHTYPVIMLTARGEEMDKINGLTLGADDYITKPFSPLEMVARVKAQLRRARRRYNTVPAVNLLSLRVTIGGGLVTSMTRLPAPDPSQPATAVPLE